MRSTLSNLLDTMFKALCFIVLFAMITYWFYKFSNDEDVCLVDYKPIKETRDVQYPEVSLCFQAPLLEEKLKTLESGLNSSSYELYLRGKLFDHKMKRINYEDVSINITEYYIQTAVVWKNGTIALVQSATPYLSFSGFKYRRFMKCYSVMTPQLNWGEVKFIDHMYNISLYLKHFNVSSGGVVARIHQPNQFVATDDAQYLSSSMNTSRGVSLGILMTSLEVLKRRNKRREPCVTDWSQYDKKYMNEHVAESGCSPPYFEPNEHFSACSDQKTIEDSNYEVSMVRSKASYYPPCLGMSKIDYEFFNNFPTKKGYLKIMIGYPEQIKVITQYQAVDVHSIIGNIGGYFGLFLGTL